MTTPILLTLDGVTCQLPDGRHLFSDLHETFDALPTGLVGRNGVGKTLLARIMAGHVAPFSGRCERHGRVGYLPQRVAIEPGQRVIDLLGLGDALDAMQRIEQGDGTAADFDCLAERWDLRQRLQQELAAADLATIDLHAPAEQLSGGQATRVALAGAFLARPDLLILDEPSNHLDRRRRSALLARLRDWRGGLIVLSHDRELLAQMARIVELSPSGLRSYGGDYAFYAQARADEQAAAERHLQQQKLTQRREERAMQAQRERLERRQAQGGRDARQANQAPILLGLQKQRSEASVGRHTARHAERREQLAQATRAAAAEVERDQLVLFDSGHVGAGSGRRLLSLQAVRLPHLTGARAGIDLTLTRGMRIAVTGDNGQGKSVLLSVLAGRVPPVAGTCEIHAEVALLDQHLGVLDAHRPILEQLRSACTGLDDSALRLRLAQLGLDADRIVLPASALSGGERLKAALASLLYRPRPVDLLLLDEPGNHLDLPSLQALESMLQQYSGSLVVVSHDPVFLDALALSHRLHVDQDGWLLQPW